MQTFINSKYCGTVIFFVVYKIATTIKSVSVLIFKLPSVSPVSH